MFTFDLLSSPVRMSYHLQRDLFTSSFPILFPLFFSQLMSLISIPSTMFNRDGDGKYAYFVPYFSKNDCCFPLSEVPTLNKKSLNLASYQISISTSTFIPIPISTPVSIVLIVFLLNGQIIPRVGLQKHVLYKVQNLCSTKIINN